MKRGYTEFHMELKNQFHRFNYNMNAIFRFYLLLVTYPLKPKGTIVFVDVRLCVRPSVSPRRFPDDNLSQNIWVRVKVSSYVAEWITYSGIKCGAEKSNAKVNVTKNRYDLKALSFQDDKLSQV